MINSEGATCLGGRRRTASVTEVFQSDCRVGVAYPFNDFHGLDAFKTHFLDPLNGAIPDLERRPMIALRSDFEGDLWEMGTGHWVGTFQGALAGIPGNGRQVALRYTEMLRFADGKVAEMYVIPDWLDLMQQTGVYPLRPSLGASGTILPPRTLDGVYPTGTSQFAEQSIELVMAMLSELGQYDGKSLESMRLDAYWDPDFIWYGPAGIGTTRGISGFRAHHQGPFLKAFPDRVVDHHGATLASGCYVGTGGWPHMHATHSGGGWLGLPPSGVYLELRVMDIWRREGDRLIENWVAIDIPHMLAQMGMDVFEQLPTMIRS